MDNHPQVIYNLDSIHQKPSYKFHSFHRWLPISRWQHQSNYKTIIMRMLTVYNQSIYVSSTMSTCFCSFFKNFMYKNSDLFQIYLLNSVVNFSLLHLNYLLTLCCEENQHEKENIKHSTIDLCQRHT